MNKEKIMSCLKAFAGVVLLAAVDQITKYLAALHLSPVNGGEDIILWNGVFRLHYLENRGAAFGIMQGKEGLLVLVSILVFCLIAWIYYRIPKERKFRFLQWIAVFLMAGAVGNFLDRVRLDYVIDFFYFELIDFPVFNVADIYVTCSVIVFAIVFLFYYKEEDLERILPSKKRKEEN